MPERPQIPPPPADPMQFEAYQRFVAEIETRYEQALADRQKIIDVITHTAESGKTLSESDADYEDRPSDVFTDPTRQRIFLVDMWHMDPIAGWFQCVFTGAGKLFTRPSPYKVPNEHGRLVAAHPIVAFSLYVSRDLWRYGEVRDMRPVQDEYNKRLSKMLHLISVSGIIYDVGAIPDGNVDAVRREAARPDFAIAKTPGKELVIDRGGQLAPAHYQLAQDARAYMETHAGANEQLQGEKGGATSGRMFLAMQQAGMGALAPVMNRFYDWELRIYRTIWARIQQFWTGPMYVRVTDDNNAARFAAVNGAPVVMGDNGMPPPLPGQNGGFGDPLAPAQPEERGPILAELDMDIIVDRAPEAATLQAEQFAELMQLAPVYAAQGEPIPLEVLLEASSLPNKAALLDKLAAKQQALNPAAMAAAEKAKAEVELARAGAAKTKADAIATIGNMQIAKRKQMLQEQEFALKASVQTAEQQREDYRLDIEKADAELAAIEQYLHAAQNSRAPLQQ